MKNILRNSNFGFTKWCVALITAGWMGMAQAGVLIDQNFATFNSGDLVGQQGWTPSGVATPNLTLANSVLVFANAGQDAGVAFTSANSGSLYLGFKMRVTSSQTGDYFASFNATASASSINGCEPNSMASATSTSRGVTSAGHATQPARNPGSACDLEMDETLRVR